MEDSLLIEVRQLRGGAWLNALSSYAGFCFACAEQEGMARIGWAGYFRDRECPLDGFC
jgi:hypothetical protein